MKADLVLMINPEARVLTRIYAAELRIKIKLLKSGIIIVTFIIFAP